MQVKHRCIEPECRMTALVNSDRCWQHIDDKERWKKVLIDQVRNGIDFSGAVFVEAGLEELDLSGIRAVSADFTGANFTGGILKSAILNEACLNRCKVDNLDITFASLQRATLNGCHGTGVQACHTDISASSALRSRFMNSNFQAAVFQDANWSGSCLVEGNFSNINGRDWFTPFAILKGSNFTEADCEFCVMGGSDLSGINAERAIFARSNLIGINGEAANFREACLHYTRLTSARLVSVDFSGADLSRTVFRTAILTGSCFDRSDRTGAVFQRVILE